MNAGSLANPSLRFARLSGGGGVEIDRALGFNLPGLLTLLPAREIEHGRFAQHQRQTALEALGLAANARKTSTLMPWPRSSWWAIAGRWGMRPLPPKSWRGAGWRPATSTSCRSCASNCATPTRRPIWPGPSSRLRPRANDSPGCWHCRSIDRPSRCQTACLSCLRRRQCLKTSSKPPSTSGSMCLSPSAALRPPPTMIGADHRDLVKKITRLVPDSRVMGDKGMQGMAVMEMHCQPTRCR